MDQENKKKLEHVLLEKGVKSPCPRCDSFNFEVVGNSIIALHEDTFDSSGYFIPVGVVACSNCGFINLHALERLNLMPKLEK